MFWAGIGKLYYANTLAEASDLGFDIKRLAETVRADLHNRALPAEQLLHT